MGSPHSTRATSKQTSSLMVCTCCAFLEVGNNACAGKWVKSASGKTFDTFNPATEEVIAKVQEADKEDVNRAGM